MSFNFSPPTHVSLVRRLPAALRSVPAPRAPLLTAQKRWENAHGLCPCAHSLSAPATLMLPALCKELPAGFFAAFDLVCSLPPLPLCGGVSDKTHMSFRTRYAAAAERNKKHTKSSEAPAPPYCSQKVGFPRQSGGQGACPLCFSGGRAGGGLFQKRPSLANRQRASALLICCAALGTPRAAPRKAGSLSQRDLPLLAVRGRQPF